jgi:Tfp pilus assembly protein PilF
MLTRGDLANAKNEIDTILKSDPKDRQAIILRARSEMQSGDPGDMKVAIEDLREVLKQEPNSRPGLFFMADANFRLGQIDQARVFAGDLDRNYPDYLPGKLMQVQINLAAGDAKTALQLASQLMDRIDKASPDRELTPQLLSDLRANALVYGGTRCRAAERRPVRQSRRRLAG